MRDYCLSEGTTLVIRHEGRNWRQPERPSAGEWMKRTSPHVLEQDPGQQQTGASCVLPHGDPPITEPHAPYDVDESFAKGRSAWRQQVSGAQAGGSETDCVPACPSLCDASVLCGAQLRVLSRPAGSLAPWIDSVFVHSNIPIFKNGLVIHVCDFILFPPILKTPTNIFLNLRIILT